MQDPHISEPQIRLTPDVRREQLILATIKAIAEHGLSQVTLSKLGAEVGLTAGMINFHYASKQALLTATLQAVVAEYDAAWTAALNDHADDPVAALNGLILASLDTHICAPDKVAVWYAFWGEAGARDDYMALCGQSDKAFFEAVHGLIGEIAERQKSSIDVKAAALGLSGMIDAMWFEVVVTREAFDYTSAVESCQAYFNNLLPGTMAAKLDMTPAPNLAANDELPRTLPGWTYCSEDFYRQEIEQIHLPAWQVVCHHNDIANAGDYQTFEAFGERAFVIRGEDGIVRAFNNVCPHRAHQVLAGNNGNCPGLIRCPYHSWGFDHTGDLKAIAAQKTFPPFDNGQFGLKPLELDTYNGFIFIRFKTGGPSMAERMQSYDSELAPYRFEDLVRIGDVYDQEIEADWKNNWDNYLEDYHFPTGHPGLFGLMSMDYAREPNDETRVIKLHHYMRDKAKGGWSCERYAKLLPDQEHLPADQRRSWRYYFAYPSFAFDVYPEGIDFFHVIPIAPGRARLRFAYYGLPDASREIKACRYLSSRINMQVHTEDGDLVKSVQKGLESSSYTQGLLGTKEIAVAALQRWVREDVPNTTEKI